MVLIGGCFDLIHYGHLQFLKKAKALGDKLIVMLESDEFIIKRKYRRPIHNQKQRAELLLGLKFVDKVVKLPYLTSYAAYLKVIKKLQPKIIAITKGDPQLANKQKQAEAVGAKIIIVNALISNLSTRKIIDKLGN